MNKETVSFLFDRMLGKTCRKMRLLGFDAVMNPEGETGRFLLNAQKEGRIAVTRARRRGFRLGPDPIIIESDATRDQIVELLKKLNIPPSFKPFTRCLECNTVLVDARPDDVNGKVPVHVAETFKEFYRCPTCGRIYWKGTHFEAMSREIEKIAEAF